LHVLFKGFIEESMMLLIFIGSSIYGILASSKLWRIDGFSSPSPASPVSAFSADAAASISLMLSSYCFVPASGCLTKSFENSIVSSLLFMSSRRAFYASLDSLALPLEELD